MGRRYTVAQLEMKADRFRRAHEKLTAKVAVEADPERAERMRGRLAEYEAGLAQIEAGTYGSVRSDAVVIVVPGGGR